jgi:cholesterol oxidase
LDGSQGPEFFIEDGGFPDLLGNLLEHLVERGARSFRFRPVLAGIGEMLRGRDPMRTAMPWFAQGIDAADGRLYLGRTWESLWLRKRLKLDWDVERSKPTIEAIIAMHKKLSAVTGGDPWVPPTWTLLKNLVTPHPLGGCNMGQTPSDGVVNHLGGVFGYPGLYVADGAIVPEAVGLNPSKTIAALAERIAATMA